MLPIRDSVLRLDYVAELWSRELNRVRTPAEIHAELLASFWHAELSATYLNGLKPMDRKNVLRAINSMRMREHPGFVLVDCAEMIPPKS